MGHIGKVIRQYREKQNLSRADIVDGICTEKYLYLIEQGKRTPSVSIVRQLGNRLSVDFFKYYEYLECKYPTDILECIEEFSLCRRLNDMEKLIESIRKAKKISDFLKEPWSIEIKINEIIYNIQKEGEIKESIVELEKTLHEMDSKFKNDIYGANILMLLSSCYQINSDLRSSEQVLKKASEITEGKEEVYRYLETIIAIKISKIALYYLNADYDRAISEGEQLYFYQVSKSANEKFLNTFFYIAAAYYEKGMEREAIDWFAKVLYISLINDKHQDLYFYTQYEVFPKLLYSKEVPESLRRKFREKYSEYAK